MAGKCLPQRRLSGAGRTFGIYNWSDSAVDMWTCRIPETTEIHLWFHTSVACLPFAIPVYFFCLFSTPSESHQNKAQDLICSREFLSKRYCYHSAYLWFPSNIKDLCFFFVSTSRWSLILNWEYSSLWKYWS